ncbi:MAG: hypothetical protein ACREQI_10630 [Candidatus Binataceae bacterium]
MAGGRQIVGSAALAYTKETMVHAAKIIAASAIALALAGLSSCMTPPASYPPLGASGSSQLGSPGGWAPSGGRKPRALTSDSGTVTGGTIDSGRSKALSAYLQQHRLPLVKAQVVTDSSGGEEVILYGYAARQFGKADAEHKARSYMKNPSLVVDNRIVVSPALANNPNADAAAGPGSAPGNGGASGSAGTPNMPGADAYLARQAQQYGPPGAFGAPSGMYGSTSSPLMMLLLPLLMGGGSFNAGSGGLSGGFGGYGPGYGGFGGYPSYPPPAWGPPGSFGP